MLNASTPKAVTGNELVFPLPGGPVTTIIRARITQRHPVSSVVSESGNISGGSSLDTSLPSASTIPKRSKRARALARSRAVLRPAPRGAGAIRRDPPRDRGRDHRNALRESVLSSRMRSPSQHARRGRGRLEWRAQVGGGRALGCERGAGHGACHVGAFMAKVRIATFNCNWPTSCWPIALRQNLVLADQA